MMELDVKMQRIECCETARRVTVSHEETMETAIPEYCPDMARIVDAVGQLKLREKKLSGGRLTLGGAVRVTVLYTSGESAGLRSLVLTVPFNCLIDDERLQGCRNICGSGRLQLVEARAVTARKLYLRVMPEFEVEGIACPERLVCSEVANEPSIQLRREEREVTQMVRVLEREFNFHHECLQEPGRETPEELLLDRGNLRVSGCQRMGAKLIVKGEVELSLLYRTQTQGLCSFDTVLPFSHIMEAGDVAEDALFQAEVWVADSDVRMIRTDSGPGFGISLRIGLAVKVYERRHIRSIVDLYSTRCQTDVNYAPCILTAAQPPQVLRQEAVQRLEFGSAKPFTCVTGLECGAVSLEPEGEGTALRTNLRMKLLYMDEAGSPVSTERTMEVSVKTPRAPDAVRAVCAPVIMNLGGSSCELRIPVDFFLEQTEQIPIETVCSLQLHESEAQERPSVILRRVSNGETLWTVAKACRTDPAVIEQANGLEKGSPLPEGMLLIPKVRA